MSKPGEGWQPQPTDREGEASLIRAALAGDAEAYGQLVERYQQRVFNVVARMVGPREAVEELVQEVFIKGFRKLGSFRFESSFFTWLYTIALNTCRNHYRQPAPRMASLDDEDGPVGELSAVQDLPDAVVFQRERAAIIREALDRLPEEQREALVMCDLEGLSYQEIAAVLDVPIGTVRSRIFRARGHLRDLLPDDLG